MVNKYEPSKYEVKHGLHNVIIASDVDHCCYIHIMGDEDLNDGRKCSIPFIGVGMLRTYPQIDSLWWRIKAAWKLIRGTLWTCELEFWTRQDAERFLASMKEVVDAVFKEGEPNEEVKS